MYLNQAGQPVVEELLYAHGMTFEPATEEERDKAIALVCQHLGVEIVRTNATKPGTTEVVLRKVGSDE